LVPANDSVLTGGLTNKNRIGTLIDWNLCFNARGESTNRSFKSGTPAFMAPVLLDDGQITRRTLGHDMESFFAVIIWMATLDPADEVAFLAKPLPAAMVDKKKSPVDIVNAKGYWFGNLGAFLRSVLAHFELQYLDDAGFLQCILNLREILYPQEDINVNEFLRHGLVDKVTEDADPMKEGLFRQCMKEIDDYLHDTKGCDEMRWIDSAIAAIAVPVDN